MNVIEGMISVIVPVYKVEPYLSKCIDSIISQTYINLEIILVDDGSPDRCGEICDGYAKSNKRVIVLHKDNGGLSDARNAGIEIATGEYIGFVDSDDWIDNDMYETLYIKGKKYDADIVICDKYIVKMNKILIPSTIQTKERETLLSKEEAMAELIQDNKISSHAWNKLYKRKLFAEIRFPFGKVYEDVFVMHKLFDLSKTIVRINDAKYYYVQREGSIISSSIVKDKIDYYYAVKKRLEDTKEKYPEYQRTLIRDLRGMVIDVYSTASRLKIRAYKKNYSEIRSVYKDYIKQYFTHSHSPFKQNVQWKMICFSPWLYFIMKKLTVLVKKNYVLYAGYIGFKALCNKLLRSKKNDEIRQVLPNGKKIFLIGVPEYNNLGDHAIAYATNEFLKNLLPEYHVIEITEKKFYNQFLWLKKNLKNSDVIILQGGGNIGNQYQDQEKIRKEVIRQFENNKIIVFPQTIYFTDDQKGRKAKKLMQSLYSRHKDLTIVAREKISYQIMKECFTKNKIILSPDIVMFLCQTKNEYDRNGVILCLRSDLESAINADDFMKIKKMCRECFENVRHTETCFNYSIPIQNRDQVLLDKWEEFSKAELVVTDRLHGVIFAAITSTPCIAFRNYNHKIKGIYEWLEHYNYIKLCDDIRDFDNLMRDLRTINTAKYEKTYLDSYFSVLVEAIRK